MFETGFSELALLFVIGLLVLGPQRLPKVAAEIGKWVGRARRTATQLRRQLEREIELAELEANSPPPPTPPATTTSDAATTPTANEPVGSAPAAPTESATTRQISDAISEHAAAPAPAAAHPPQESTDKPPPA
jgi:sec-independent protein translocase protein TatB